MPTLFPEPDFAVQLREELDAPDVRHVLSLFAGDLQHLTDSIRHAAESGLADAVRKQAHALAGAAGAVGAADLERACRTVMTALRDNSDGLAQHLANIEIAAQAAEIALARVRAELPDRTAGRA